MMKNCAILYPLIQQRMNVFDEIGLSMNEVAAPGAVGKMIERRERDFFGGIAQRLPDFASCVSAVSAGL